MTVIDFQDRSSVEKHDRLAALVSNLLDIKTRKSIIPLADIDLQRRSTFFNEQINAIVYNLFELRDTEIDLLEVYS